METNRRDMLKGIAAAAAMTALPVSAIARERRKASPGSVGMLYDATKCIGCKTCVVACRDNARTKAETTGYGDGIYDAPMGLTEHTKNVIALYKDGDEYSYVKKQCMHCIDPACATACMLGALQKTKIGVVEWDGDRCIGCRYCQTACPFNVPKFEWSKTNPKIVKCELCKERLAEGKVPACVEVCPRQAIIFGQYADLLDEAHRRIESNPHYVQKVYGEHDLGGTQVLYLSHVPFEKLGFRFDDRAPVPEVQQTIQHGVYQGFAAPIALYTLLGAVMFRNRRKNNEADDEK